jgi:hypothetical protein
MRRAQVARLLAYVTGMVNQQLLQQNEYLLIENRILRAHLPSRLLLTNPERSTLAVLGKRIGGQGLEPWLRLPNRTPFSPGFGSWSLISSIARGAASIQDDAPWT